MQRVNYGLKGISLFTTDSVGTVRPHRPWRAQPAALGLTWVLAQAHQQRIEGRVGGLQGLLGIVRLRDP